MNDDIRKIVISSPDVDFISVLYDQFNTWDNVIGIGSMKFKVDSLSILESKIPSHIPFTLITGTPIIIRIPREKYKKFGVEPRMEYQYLYWRVKKQISTKIVMKNTEQVVIGTVWEEILDVGLGERNSMGFGFMNLKKV